ncbi:VOC family protein [Paenibacillus rigui]|uniref:PhnB-like domain-containing protein n=1 Tax=Paenibacillus rigui TaxID=554312 RepID=A0A229UNG5_9BACL|nr:VOC family protein [Paenibacillus rigui]OXM84921.1 hypothetical protein CF651_18645 [Paenibacillus rigui]
MKLTPYLMFQGNAEEAMHYYAHALGGEIEMIQRYIDGKGMTIPEHYANKVLHGRLKAGTLAFYFSDTFPGQQVTRGDQVSLTIEFDSEERTDQVYEILKVGAEVRMPLQQTFWGAKYAKLIDRYGIQWDLNYHYS